MRDSDALHDATLSALAKLLRPLVRILMKAGVSSDAATEVLRQTFVQVAEVDFALAEKKQSDSRISILTGLSRKQVAKYRKVDESQQYRTTTPRNRVERVITGWLCEPQFLDEENRPKQLPIEGTTSFTALVSQFAGDVPVRAVLDELKRIGNVIQTESGDLRLAVTSYAPAPFPISSIGTLGTQAADFLENLDKQLAANDHAVSDYPNAAARMPSANHKTGE